MKYQYRFPIGDWSGDGHKECIWYTVEADKPVEDAREAHFKCPEVLGFEIGEMCSGHNESILDKDIYETLREKEIITEKMQEEYCYNGEFSPGPHELFEIWVGILNFIDPDLNLKSAREELPTITFYGFDKKNRHLANPGYGVIDYY